ncbi:hypothetical protein RhiXN_04921 [Rhizoctonia solani]|uniref:Uncharacterized protein n=1 Tax=Rhizoctonia solani TaxID=456999 RepID=A0A8H8STB9_9AGAM|nr:uncharacterized protein RhiXN_04921 [Rhizoctonia solani]QRW16919.1 hypothetical protein RhiXN_04921 [Rhizoctonia solani]
MSPLYLAHSVQMPTPPPPAPVTAATPQYAAVKVDHLDPYKGKRMFTTQTEILLFLLMNMDDAASMWAHPHLDLLGSHCAIIQNTDDFKRELLGFGDPGATRAAENHIAHTDWHMRQLYY